MNTSDPRRVIVVGAGLAGLCAALSARETGAEVVLLEASPLEVRGGNSRFSNGSFRVAHDGIGHGGLDDLGQLVRLGRQPQAGRTTVDPYTAAKFRDDIMTTSHNRSNPDELGLVVRESFEIARWLADHGVLWELNLKFAQAQDLASCQRIELDPGASLAVVDSGKGLVEPLFQSAEAAGVDIRYETTLDDFLIQDGAVVGANVVSRAKQETVLGSVVLASGGFEANPEMRRKYLGPGWDLVAVRGSRYNTGRGLARALSLGAMPGGHWGGCHVVPTDADIPLMGDLDLSARSERYSYANGLLINEDGIRFVDEGADIFTMTYTKVGAAIAAQPGGNAYQVFDAHSCENLQQHYYTHGTPIVAATLEELAAEIGVPGATLQATVSDFNDACTGSDETPSRMRNAQPITQPPKSQWATPLDRPPFVAYRVTAGISFTYGGILTSPQMAVHHIGGHEIPGLYAAGGIVGGLFYHDYPAASALTRAAVCGRVAGRSSAERRLTPRTTAVSVSHSSQ